MNDQHVIGMIESMLFVSGSDGLTIQQIKKALSPSTMSDAYIATLLLKLKQAYESPARGISLVELDAHYYLTTKKEHGPYLQTLVKTNKQNKLSPASLETLAIISYNQPVTRVEIDEIRGVKSDRPLQTLLSRGLIEEAGKKDVVGRPLLYKTTVDFLTYFGLRSIEELPPLTSEPDEIKDESALDLFFKNNDKLLE